MESNFMKSKTETSQSLEKANSRKCTTSAQRLLATVTLLPVLWLTLHFLRSKLLFPHSINHGSISSTKYPISRLPSTIDYNLTLSQAWRNPDGGYWRPLFVGNSESPFPTISVNEGDLLRVHIHNDLGLPVSLHWVGMHHSNSMVWNDGTSGVTFIPILPRSNFTALLNTTGQWGLKWYLDHTSTPSVDGNYGTIWIRPRTDRKRPYHLVSEDAQDMQDMADAEQTPEHLIMYNHQHREMPGLLAQLQAEGYDPYCFQSVLINGKGRVHCGPAEVHELDGNAVDSHGCVRQASNATAYPRCLPSDADYEVIQTNNRRWIMMNFVNPGLEHPWRVSIDHHDFWIVANDGGFVEPRKVKVLTITNAERVTVMVKLDKEPKDYAIRFYALSRLQSLQGYAILRYPHRRIGQRLGTSVPQPDQKHSSMHLDGTPKDGVALEDKLTQHPFPPQPPPQQANITLRFRATGAPDPYNPYITNCSLNGVSWQIFRALMDPTILDPKRKIPGPNPAVKNLPVGSVIDIIVENDLPVTLPMYKHNDPTFLLGRGNTKFKWNDVATAAKEDSEAINLYNPPLGYLHELPANGWMAVRWKITQPAMTMFHVFRVRYFVLGMQVPLFEGDDAWPEIPEWVGKRPHVEIDEIPGHGGIFD